MSNSLNKLPVQLEGGKIGTNSAAINSLLLFFVTLWPYKSQNVGNPIKNFLKRKSRELKTR